MKYQQDLKKKVSEMNDLAAEIKAKSKQVSNALFDNEHSADPRPW
jgi:hypothetical protein